MAKKKLKPKAKKKKKTTKVVKPVKAVKPEKKKKVTERTTFCYECKHYPKKPYEAPCKTCFEPMGQCYKNWKKAN